MHPQAILSLPALTTALTPNYTTSPAGNPFIPGWYADPNANFFPSTGQYWVYPTSSLPYDQQIYLDAFSSPDLINWTRHPSILTTTSVSWATRAVWAPCVVARNDKYYLYFGANDIQEGETTVGGIGVAVADSPAGPFVDALGKPLIGDYHYGAQPIDQDVFIDDDGQGYIYYGGHSHAVMAKLNDDMISLGNFSDGETYREITPPGYVEGPVVFKRKGRYYMMWSEGGWGGPDYAVAYGMADSPLGPFERRAKVLSQDSAVATGSGHNGVVNVPGTDIWYIVYHRRPLGETDQNHRVVCYDRMYFDAEGNIEPVRMLVRDDFSDGNLIGWKSYDAVHGGFEVVDGEMRNIIPKEGLNASWGLALMDTNFTDLVYEADVRIIEDHADDYDREARLVFRATKRGPEEFYYYDGYFAAISANLNRIMIGKSFYGSGDMGLGEADMDIEVGRTYHVKVTAVGNKFELFVDDMADPKVYGIDVESEFNPLYLNGTNGVYVSFAKAGFDNIAIDKLET
jgi:hypothetical protein